MLPHNNKHIDNRKRKRKTHRLVLDFSLPLPRVGEEGGTLSMSLKGWVWSGLTVSLKMGGAGSRWIPAVVSRAGVEGPGLS